jgi:hypothetical protein
MTLFSCRLDFNIELGMGNKKSNDWLHIIDNVGRSDKRSTQWSSAMEASDMRFLAGYVSV